MILMKLCIFVKFGAVRKLLLYLICREEGIYNLQQKYENTMALKKSVSALKEFC